MQSSTLAALTAALTVALPAQDAAQPLPAPIADWMTPIHTQPDDPEHGAYGLWAAGPDYKVAFGRGFTFYPVLGEAYTENLPLAWRTQRVAVGARVLVDETSTSRAIWGDWRYELRYPEITEAYDVLREGVEQTFVLHRPAGVGDLVVSGRITSKLRAALAPAGHQTVSFADAAGRELVVYGKAFAIDAAGRRLELTTCFDGESVELRVPAVWLAGAEYPVVVDPLTSRTPLALGGSLGETRRPNIARDDGNNQLMAVYTRFSSLTDMDAWARLRGDDFAHVALAYTDITDSWSTSRASVAFVTGSSKWVVALQRNALLTGASLVVYVHDDGNTTQNSGSTMFLAKPANAFDQRPSVGGSATIAIGGLALLVFQRDLGASSTPASRVHGVTIDPLNLTFGTVRDLHTNGSITSFDAEYPSVTANAATGGSWIVVWQEYNDANANDDWDIIAQRVRGNGTLAGDAVLGRSSAFDRHKLLPVVDGRAGRYLLAYMMHDKVSKAYDLVGDEITLQRFDWGEADAAPQGFDHRTLAATGGPHDLQIGDGSRSIAYDHNTDSHWAVGYLDNAAGDLFVARVGFSGLTVESQTVFSDGTDAAFQAGICFDDDASEFALVFGTNEASNPTYGVRFQYGPAANVPYAGGCAGVLTGANRGLSNAPFAGSQFFEVRMTGGLPNAPSVLMLGFGPGAFPMPGGCLFLLDPLQPVLAFPGGASDAAGNYSVPVALIDSIASADIYWQVIQLARAGLSSSDGLITRIR
jgi:hypothetical protein